MFYINNSCKCVRGTWDKLIRENKLHANRYFNRQQKHSATTLTDEVTREVPNTVRCKVWVNTHSSTDAAAAPARWAARAPLPTWWDAGWSSQGTRVQHCTLTADIWRGRGYVCPPYFLTGGHQNPANTQQLCTSAKHGGNTTPYSYCLLYLVIYPGNVLVFQLQPQVGSHMHSVFHHSLTELPLPERVSSSSTILTYILSF